MKAAFWKEIDLKIVRRKRGNQIHDKVPILDTSDEGGLWRRSTFFDVFENATLSSGTPFVHVVPTSNPDQFFKPLPSSRPKTSQSREPSILDVPHYVDEFKTLKR